MNNEITQPTRPGAIDKTSGTPSGFPDHAFEHDGTENNANPTLTLKSPWALEVEEPLVFSDDNNIGTLHIIPEADRPDAWVLNAGAATTFTDVDFGTYTPAKVKGLYLKYMVRFGGNGVLDIGRVHFRANGSTGTDINKQVRVDIYRKDMTNGITIGQTGGISLECDSSGVIEYIANDAAVDLYLNILGYYI